MSRTATLLRLLVLAAAALLVAGCGSSGRDLREPPPGQTAPPRKPSSAGTVTSTVPDQLDVFGLATTAWSPGGPIPTRYTCDGANLSPPFAIFVPPPGAVELALVVTDLDNDLVHWIVTGISPGTSSVGEGELPPGAVEAVNGRGTEGWFGPCPPEGDEHVYEFAIYALGAPLDVAPGQDAEQVVAAISADPLEVASITGTYAR
jgi:Raf kinase inhibitor-like YbhB/YbcL family protein